LFEMADERPTHHATFGSQGVDLPIVALSDELAVALLITVDLGVAFCDTAGAELAALLGGLDVEVVACVATMGIPIAIEVSRHLGLDHYVVLHKTPKIHLADAVAEPVRSVTTASAQLLLLDRARVGLVEGRRVAIVDDVVSTGSTAAAALRLVRAVGALPVAVGVIATEGSGWRTALGEDAGLVRALGELPLFEPIGGSFAERASG
jgi:adenine/guanine phosphoribosyltransferase-like PRPP-binding protein